MSFIEVSTHLLDRAVFVNKVERAAQYLFFRIPTLRTGEALNWRVHHNL